MSMPIIKSSNIKRCQAITDVIQSVALEQTGLSHILNAEGEKIQKALETSKDNAELIKVNSSVKEMVKAITILESILQDKLHLAELYPNDCPVEPCVVPEVTVTVEDSKTGSIALSAPGVYTFTGTKKPAKIKITTTPISPITSTKAFPVGVGFVNDTISIDDTYTWTMGHALGFTIGKDTCIVDLVISIKALV